MLRCVFMSDPHTDPWCSLKEMTIPHGDVLVVAGDLTRKGTEEQLREFFKEFAALPHKYKIAVAGNHDRLFEEDPELARSLVPSSVTYLQDEEVVIEGKRFYGMPWVPGSGAGNFNAFTLPPGSSFIGDRCNAIPQGIDVLVTHGPPYGFLDGNGRDHFGCTALRWRVEDVRPKVHVFGHVHGAYGEHRDEDSGVHYVNASSANHDYKLVNAPIVVDL